MAESSAWLMMYSAGCDQRRSNVTGTQTLTDGIWAKSVVKTDADLAVSLHSEVDNLPLYNTPMSTGNRV